MNHCLNGVEALIKIKQRILLPETKKIWTEGLIGTTLIQITCLSDIITSIERNGMELKPVVNFESFSLSAKIFDKAIFCTAPPYNETNTSVIVTLSLNGGSDFTHRSIYTYFENPHITEVIPSMVSEGEEVRIIGYNFSRQKKSTCQFGDLISSVKYISTTEVMCHVPQLNNQRHNNFVDLSVLLALNLGTLL